MPPSWCGWHGGVTGTSGHTAVPRPVHRGVAGGGGGSGGGGVGASCVAAKGAHGNVLEELFVLTVGALPPCALRACGSAFDVRIPRRRGGGPVGGGGGGGGALVQIWVLLRRIPGEDLFWGFGRVEAQDPPPPSSKRSVPPLSQFCRRRTPSKTVTGRLRGRGSGRPLCGCGTGQGQGVLIRVWGGGGGGLRGAATVEVRVWGVRGQGDHPCWGGGGAAATLCAGVGGVGGRGGGASECLFFFRERRPWQCH